jgi:uncharacterized protein (DUF58 family)
MLGAAALLALVAGPTLGIAAAVIVVTATAVDMARSRREPRVQRSHPSIVPRGQAVPMSIQATAAPGRTVTVRQPVPPDLVVDPPIGSGGLTASLVAHRRGRHRLPPAATRVVGPLGLGATVRNSGAASDITVFPDILTARRLARAVATGRFSSEGLRRGSLMGIGTEFESIRDYTPDDDIRQVNWRATARLGRPMSNEYRIDQDRDVVLLIDSARLMAAPLDGLTRLDAAVDAATAVAYTADALGDRVGVVAFDRRIRRNIAPRRRGGEAVVHAIFDLEPTTEEADYDIAFRIVERMKRALVIVFTDLLETSAARPMLEAMPVLARRHSVIVAGSTDADLVTAIATPPTGMDDVYRAAVAVDALDARETVARTLERTGASVIEADVGRLPAACVRAYLEAKARARI